LDAFAESVPPQKSTVRQKPKDMFKKAATGKHRRCEQMRKDVRGNALLDIEKARDLAMDALLFILQDDQRTVQFLNMSGMSPADLRAQAREDATLAAVLEYLLGNESLLLIFCAHSRHAPEAVAPALMAFERRGGRT
jgi:hypothetical protein